MIMKIQYSCNLYIHTSLTPIGSGAYLLELRIFIGAPINSNTYAL